MSGWTSPFLFDYIVSSLQVSTRLRHHRIRMTARAVTWRTFARVNVILAARCVKTVSLTIANSAPSAIHTMYVLPVAVVDTEPNNFKNSQHKRHAWKIIKKQTLNKLNFESQLTSKVLHRIHKLKIYEYVFYARLLALTFGSRVGVVTADCCVITPQVRCVIII